MNKIFVILFVVVCIVGVLVASGVIKMGGSTTETPQPINRKKDAVCLSNDIPPLLDSSYYTVSSPILGQELNQKSQKEPFSLTGTVVINQSQLDPTAYYKVGTRIKSNTISEARYGGTPCTEFPTTIYRRV